MVDVADTQFRVIVDKEYTEWEKKELEKQEERKRLKLEKKRASRV